MNQLWQMWESSVDSSKISSIINLCERNTIEHTATIGQKARDPGAYRSSKIGWVDRHEPENAPIVDLIWRYCSEANRNAFGFDVNYLSDIQYTKYYGNTNDKYDWHIDTFWANPTSFDRKLSIIIQLSDPSEYEGGLFEFDPQIPQPDNNALRSKGTVIVFPSFLRHRVTPVTGGLRRSLVSWIEGPKFR